MDLVPARPAGAAHGVRRHRRGDRRDQRRRRGPLPAQAVGAAGGEALPGDRRAARRLAARRPHGRAQDQDPRPPAGPRRRTRSATSWPATWCPTGGTTSAEPDGQRLMAAAGATPDDIPVVITSDGDPLIRPGLAELANAVGLSTAPTEEFYDLVIVGGGPAGLGAAVYGASEGLRTVIIERAAAGGQAGQSSRIENYLGFPDGVSGDQLTERARRQALRLGAELITARNAVGLEVQGPARVGWSSTTASSVADHSGAARHRRLLPAAGRRRARRAGRPRRLLRLRLDPGDGLRRRPRDHRRRRQLGRPGRGVLRPARRPGDAGGARGVAGAVDVAAT